MSTQTQTLRKPVNINEIAKGDVFSEESHYVYLGAEGNKHKLRHLESNQIVNLDTAYVTDLLATADQYHEEVEVGLEDKLWTAKQIADAKKKGDLPEDTTVREGDLKLKGIRSIWSDIHTQKVWLVCFDKKGKALTKKAYNAAKQAQVDQFMEKITNSELTLKQALEMVQNNPVLDIEKGDERKLRGYKIQFTTNNGSYDVVDMDIEDPEQKGINVRKVNINEIKWLVYDGVRYVVA
jgi:hypothetical protein